MKCNSEKFNTIEYQTVVLAALLHDIGKLLQRKNNKTYFVSHHETTASFIKKNEKKIRNNALYDLDLLIFLVKNHHPIKINKKTVKIIEDIYIKDKDIHSQARAKKLLRIVKRGDIYSCKERYTKNQKQRKGNKRKAPLSSIFSRISLDPSLPRKPGQQGYNLETINQFKSFPQDIGELTDGELGNLINDFISNLPDFSKFNKFSDVLNVWLNYLEKFMWAVPSDTRFEESDTYWSDVSLYDHLRTSAAIAACLYKYHWPNLNGKTSFYKTREFYFIGGDFSGIQNYIFDITNIGSGGASKRLRARSLFVSLFCETTIHKILHALDLPIVCNLFSAGGKFLLLAPCEIKRAKQNISPDEIDIKDILSSVKAEIENEIHGTYFNQFAFLMHWEPIERYEKGFKIYKFFHHANKMFDSLEQKKTCKFSSVLQSVDKKWDEEAFKAADLYNKYEGEGDCKICGKGPARMPIEPNTQDEKLQCEICYQDRNVIGKIAPHCKYIAFGKSLTVNKNAKGRVILYRSSPNYYVDLLINEPEKPEDYYLIHDLSQNDNHIADGIFINRNYPNHVPSDEEGILEFGKIAAFRGDSLNQVEDKENRGMLGILKADIDNLGLIFSKGFEKEINSSNFIETWDRRTISRFITLSRMIDLFFSGWTKSVMDREKSAEIIKHLSAMEGIEETDLWNKYLSEKHIDFSMIYTVYSGGDDLVLIGPWETMIIFTFYLNMRFRKFTCNNEHITLSAGLAFVKPKFPVASAIKQAEYLLNTSKKAGKNRITLFDTTINWKQLPKLINFFLFIDSKLKDKDSKLNTSFLYRLLKYHKLALSYYDENKIEGLKFYSALSYDIGRNIISTNEDGEIKKGKEEFQKLTELMIINGKEEPLLYNIKVSIFWALYRTRLTKNNTIII